MSISDPTGSEDLSSATDSWTPVESETSEWLLVDDDANVSCASGALTDPTILRCIFAFAAAFDRPHASATCMEKRSRPPCGRCLGWIRVGHVCRRWRTLALSTPSLWTHDALTFLNVHAIDAIIVRSRELPLELAVTVTEGLDLRRLSVALYRARSLYLVNDALPPTNHPGSFADLVALITRCNTPVLEEATIGFPRVNTHESYSNRDFPILWAPRLRRLLTSGVFMSCASRALTSLCVHHITPAMRASSTRLLMNGLFSSPALEHLCISSALHFAADDGKEDLCPIVLPALQVLRVCDAAEHAFGLLILLALPPDAYIDVVLLSALPPLYPFELGLQRHVHGCLNLGHLCSVTVATAPRLSFAVLPIGHEDNLPAPHTPPSPSTRPGPGLRIDAEPAPPEDGAPAQKQEQDPSAFFCTLLGFAAHFLFPYMDRVLRFDAAPALAGQPLMPAQWLELLDPFSAVDTLRLRGARSAHNLLHALAVRPTRCLPNLTALCVEIAADSVLAHAEDVDALGDAIEEVVLSRLQTGREAVIESVRLEYCGNADAGTVLADRLRDYVPDVELVELGR